MYSQKLTIIDKNSSHNYPKLNMQTLIQNVPKEDKIDKTDITNQKCQNMAKIAIIKMDRNGQKMAKNGQKEQL